MSVLTNSSTIRPRSSNLKMLMRSQMTCAPFGLSSPAGERVNGAVKVPLIQVWHAMRSPSAMTIPRRMVRSSKASRIDWKYSVSPA